jgi:hypothetical protein
MLTNLAVVLGTLALICVVAWRANATLPAGRLPMGRTDGANTNRLLVLLQAPLLLVVALLLVALKGAVEGAQSADDILAPFPLGFLSVVTLICQQAQLWGVRRIMRKHHPTA